jgi:acyl-CoA synthetase (AMP-forming)/AMP-acid ligase II
MLVILVMLSLQTTTNVFAVKPNPAVEFVSPFDMCSGYGLTEILSRIASNTNPQDPQSVLNAIKELVKLRGVNKCFRDLLTPEKIREILIYTGIVDFNSALLLAAENGYTNCVQLLLKLGADVNAVNWHRNAALHFAVCCGHAELVNMLLNHGADMNASDSSDWTVLRFAAEYGHIETVEVLLSHGVDVSATDPYGYTALHWAVFYERAEPAQGLVNYYIANKIAIPEDLKPGLAELGVKLGK